MEITLAKMEQNKKILNLHFILVFDSRRLLFNADFIPFNKI